MYNLSVRVYIPVQSLRYIRRQPAHVSAHNKRNLSRSCFNIPQLATRMRSLTADQWYCTVPVPDGTGKKCTRQLCTKVQIVQCKMKNLHLFSIEIESVEECLERFKIQNGDKLDKAGSDGFKKARILANSLPTRVVTDIQCRIKPKLLTETSFEELERQLTSSYSIKKSVTGAARNFVTRKQKPC